MAERKTETKKPTVRHRATLRDVADAVGVHVSTVSRALDPKTRHKIRAEVAERILRTSEQLQYRPNSAAYSLRTNRTRTVGVIIPDITSLLFPPIIRGIEDVLSEKGYVAILVNTDDDAAREALMIETLIARGVDGLIVASAPRRDETIVRLEAEGVGVVTVNRRTDDPSVSSVVSDDADGIRQVMTHLTGLGHRRIAAIAGPQKLSTGKLRHEAFEQCRKDMELPCPDGSVVFAEVYNEDEGERAAHSLLEAGIDATALVCANDRLAIGALSALKGQGLSVPERISVTGFNDLPLTDRLSPPLTTVRISQYDVGRRAAEILFAKLDDDGNAHTPRHDVLPVELVIRQSTASPAG